MLDLPFIIYSPCYCNSPAYKPPELVSVPYDSYTLTSLLRTTNDDPSVPKTASGGVEIVLTESIDVWSMGCVIYTLAFGISPFESLTEGRYSDMLYMGYCTYSIPYVYELLS